MVPTVAQAVVAKHQLCPLVTSPLACKCTRTLVRSITVDVMLTSGIIYRLANAVDDFIKATKDKERRPSRSRRSVNAALVAADSPAKSRQAQIVEGFGDSISKMEGARRPPRMDEYTTDSGLHPPQGDGSGPGGSLEQDFDEDDSQMSQMAVGYEGWAA